MIASITRFTRSRIECDHRLRQRGTFSSYRCSFSRSQRENEQQKMGKYHAAAGTCQREADRRVTRLNNRK
jgi:hypothetical protein